MIIINLIFWVKKTEKIVTNLFISIYLLYIFIYLASSTLLPLHPTTKYTLKGQISSVCDIVIYKSFVIRWVPMDRKTDWKDLHNLFVCINCLSLAEWDGNQYVWTRSRKPVKHDLMPRQ